MTAVRDATAFGLLAREHLPRLYSLERRLLRAFRHFGELRDERAAERRFNTILVNGAKDRYRAAGRSPEVPPANDSTALSGSGSTSSAG